MPSKDMAPGPTGQRVAENVWKLRADRGLTKTELAQMVTNLGRPMTLDVITKLEAGQRRVDTDDLMALALALRCTVNRLLLPAQADHGTKVPLTPLVTSPSAWRAWSWACGETPSPGVGLVPWEDYIKFPSENKPHRGVALTKQQAERFDHVIEPLRQAVIKACEEGVSAATVTTVVEGTLQVRSITDALNQQVITGGALPPGIRNLELFGLPDDSEGDNTDGS